MEPATIVLATAAVTGLYMAWNIGANDVANAMGTSVGSGALTLKRAVFVAAIFEFGGALLVGGTVTETVKKGIVDLPGLGADPMTIAVGMTASLLAAALWLNLASYLAWPVSTTHSIVGAVAGFGIAAGGFGAVQWGVMVKIVASWAVSPMLGGLIGFTVFSLVRRRILNADAPLLAVRGWGPILLFPIFTVLSLAMMFKGLKPLRLDLPLGKAALVAVGIGVVVTLVLTPVLRRFTRARGSDYHESLRRTEQVFLVFQILTACFVAFAHGSNDVANAVGPMAAVFGALREGVSETVEVPVNVLLIGAVGIVVGLATYGYKVMGTVGREITELTPSRGFSAEFAAAITIVIASKLGLPVSTTHTLVGSVIGVGLARSIGALNLSVIRGIVVSWIATVPFAGVLSAILFLIGRALL